MYHALNLQHKLMFTWFLCSSLAVSNRKLESVPRLAFGNSEPYFNHAFSCAQFQGSYTTFMPDVRAHADCRRHTHYLPQHIQTRMFYLTCSSQVIEEVGKGMGEVFLEMVLLLAPPYMTYITVHPWALAHLDVLSSPSQLTPQFSRMRGTLKELIFGGILAVNRVTSIQNESLVFDTVRLETVCGSLRSKCTGPKVTRKETYKLRLKYKD
ncbi:hypothetical protein DEU56DRAFT_762293 [Suillus clintonianus]|uniref:uncharacterized protein n=1 Tax=Suillus clintonianus TaxID=1904413 RepID=UPI001B87A6BD|nr:uncharacterized protein DEU56DRAFT_762293 [Suillus clintonianus]KAG2110690.1 hypothetical protein DEU56DRAFT_762293 [Suillus clintonianus]